MNVFEEANRKKLRFESSKGNLTVEDLWDLPLTSARVESLDRLAIAIHKEIQETEEGSFVSEKKTNTTLAIKLDILKHIIKVKIEERENAKLAATKKAKKAELVSILAEKENDNLRNNTSVDDIKKMIAEL